MVLPRRRQQASVMGAAGTAVARAHACASATAQAWSRMAAMTKQ